MELTTSYAISLDVNRKQGIAAVDNTLEYARILDQGVNRVLLNGQYYKQTYTLKPSEESVINLVPLGIDWVYQLIIQSAATIRMELTHNLPAVANNLAQSQTHFLHFGEPPGVLLPRTTTFELKVRNLNSTKAEVSLLVVGLVSPNR